MRRVLNFSVVALWALTTEGEGLFQGGIVQGEKFSEHHCMSGINYILPLSDDLMTFELVTG